jgi:protein SCO1
MRLSLALVILATSSTALAEIQASAVTVEAFPDEVLVDQDGKSVRILSDVLQGRPAVINFIFTRCTTICSPLSATMAAVQRRLSETPGRTNPVLLSISLDPEFDTPARLKAFSEKFGRKPGWTLLTGSKATVDKLLAALGGAVARKEAHSPQWLVGNVKSGQWKRAVGLGIKPDELLALVPETTSEINRIDSTRPDKVAADQTYFTNTELTDQEGLKHKFYDGLLKDKTVIVNFGFTSCKGACSPISQNLSKVQELLGTKLESQVRILTISVDPKVDSPEKLKAYAARFKRKPGWYFLTGPQDSVNVVLKKLGGLTKTPDEHPTTLFIGDMRKGIWTKTNAGESPQSIAYVAEHVGDEK